MEIVQGKITEYDHIRHLLTLQASGFRPAEVQKLFDKDIDIKLEKHREHRSLDANSYCWVLCDRIAKEIGSTKELIYKDFIRDKGVFDFFPVEDALARKCIDRWGRLGIGFFAEPHHKSKQPGYTVLIRYYGSHVYDVHEMYVLLQEIIYQCQELEIETKPKEELDSMYKAWGQK